LAFAGHVVAIVVFDKKGRLAADPRIVGYGLPRGAEGDLDEALTGELEDALYDAMEALTRPQAQDDEAVEEQARRALRAAIKERWGKRPVISVEIIRLEN
ncbi:MAG TPA: MBL fold metallo-hydrolase, partial [Alphaproteobacteria bacterium]|nr:MBL fold metallo-hydrolase [Alphaproteobacteria bacterium]